MSNSFLTKIYRVLKATLTDGLITGIKFALVQFLGREVSIRFKGFKHPVSVRPELGEIYVAFHTFIKKEYPIREKQRFTTILDLGAHVGFSAVYFAHYYPEATIVCLEPSGDNFNRLRENTKHYKNIVLINKGVWWRQTHLALTNRAQFSCTYQVDEAEDATVPCIAIDALLQEYHQAGKVLVKMDIEGAEKQIFKNCNSWIEMTSCILLEIHGCWKEVFDRLSHFDYQAKICGENVIIDLDGPKVS